MSALLEALRTHQPLPHPHDAAVAHYLPMAAEAARFEPARFTAPRHEQPGDPHFVVDGEDLSNELDTEVCDYLLQLLDCRQYERAGRVLQALRMALLRRWEIRSKCGEVGPELNTMAVARGVQP